MYCRFYGFSERPFEVTPDPKFLYLSPIHREVHSALLYGIRERRGFIAVLGEAGTGKTTLLRSVLKQLEEKVKVATIINTDVTFDEFLHMVMLDLGLVKDNEQLGKVAAIQRLNDMAIEQLCRRGNVVIMVDEAQNLDRRCLENLRLLSNLETSKTKLLQIILSGQPELEDKLRRSDLRQLLQRINLRRYLLPFDEKETYAYIRYRLNTAHYEGPTLFSRGAQGLIWEYSGGIPRKINTVCDNALLTGYAMKCRKVDINSVQEVIDDLTRNPFAEKSARPSETLPDPIPVPQPEAEPPRNQSRVWRLLLPVAGLSLLAGIGLETWRHHWNEKSTTILPDPIQTSVTEVQPPPSNIAVPSSRLATDADRVPFPGAVLVTATETGLLPFPQSQAVPIQKETSPLLTHEANLTPSEAEEHLTAAKEEWVVASRAQAPTTVRVRNGDSLYSIIVQNFGKYDKALEQEILHVNPGIKDPHLIYAEQIITLPDIKRTPER